MLNKYNFFTSRLFIALLICLSICLIPSSGTYAQGPLPTHQIFLPHMGNDYSGTTISDPTVAEPVVAEPTIRNATTANNAQNLTLGDVNCDGVANSIDALFLLQYEVGYRRGAESCPLARPHTELNLLRADVDEDGLFNAVDAMLIMQCDANMENRYCDSLSSIDPPHNVAFGKAATQSTIVYASDVATRAVDGQIPETFSIRETTQTKSELSAWWQVDLGAIYDLSSIEITHFIEECCTEEQFDLYVLVSEQPFVSTHFETTLAQENVQAYQYSRAMTIAGAARYLRLQLDGVSRRSLVLGEVRVMGRLAAGQPVPDFRSTFGLGVGAYSTGLQRADAVEKNARTALVHINRPTAVDAVTLSLSFNGSGDPARASANADDYVLIDESGAEISDSMIEFLAGQFERSVRVKALQDSLIEVPEALQIQLQDLQHHDVDPDASTVQLTLRDAEAGITASSRLLFGEMVPENNAETSATGLATIQLSDDNSYGIVNSSFTQLSSVQIAAHIHAELPGGPSGPSIFDLPLGDVTNRQWDIEAEAHLATDQEVLDALLAGDLYINAHSANYDEGEIRATLRNTQASQVMQPVPDPEPIEPLTGDELTRDIVRFLTQATFGPTPASVDEMQALVNANGGDRIAAYNAWITEQITPTGSISPTFPSMLDYVQASRSMYLDIQPDAREVFANINNGITPAWFAASVYGKSQLRERVGFALNEIFVVSLEDGALGIRPWAVADYNDMLRGNAFGQYKTLLNDVSRHPAMGMYLSHLKNRKQELNPDGTFSYSPDENYAREIMQIFSIGLVNLHPDGTLRISNEGLPTRTYDQDDITALARVFTGWNFDPSTVHPSHTNNFIWIMHVTTQTDDHPYLWTPMTMWQNYHDTGAKLVLGTNIAAGQNGEDELNTVMDILNDHQNTAPFISYRLIQRLVTSNPSRGYIYRVATKFEATNGNLGEVVRAILLDPEARNLSMIDQVAYGKIKEPLVHLTNIMRVVRPQTILTSTHNTTTLVGFGLPASEVALYEDDMQLVTLNYKRFGRRSDGFYQSPLQAPSVFNWFLPSYAPSGQIAGSGLVAPEMQHATEANTIAYYNVFSRFLYNTTGTPKNRGLLGETPQAGYIPSGYTEPQPYINTSYDTARTFQWLGNIYLSALDEMADDGVALGNPAYTSPTAVRHAIGAMVDTVDLYVCAGHLQFEATGHPETDPREIIIDGIQDAWDNYDELTGPAYVELARTNRIKDTLLLVSAAPQCMIQR